MKKSIEYIKNGLKNIKVYISLSYLEKESKKYDCLADSIKNISTYLKGTEEGMDDEIYNLGKELRKKEVKIRLKGFITPSKKRYLEDFINEQELINNELLNNYCLQISKCVENINKKNVFLKNVDFNHSRYEIYFNQIKENIRNSSIELFEKLNDFSDLINKEAIIPDLVNEDDVIPDLE